MIKTFQKFKFKSRFINKNNDNSTVNEKIATPLKYLSNVWENLEILLFNNEINLILIW